MAPGRRRMVGAVGRRVVADFPTLRRLPFWSTTVCRFPWLMRDPLISPLVSTRWCWGGTELNDVFSTVTRPGSTWDRPVEIRENHGFMTEAESVGAVAKFYARRPAD